MSLNSAARAMLVSIALAAVQGCIPIPLPEHPLTRRGQPVRTLVGSSSSARPLRIDISTRVKVEAQLGEPRWSTLHEDALGYHYLAASTYWIGPFVVPGSKHVWPFIAPYTSADYFLFLQFDDAGVLRRYQLRRDDGRWEGDKYWKEFLKPVMDPDTATTRPAPKFDEVRGKPRLDWPE